MIHRIAIPSNEGILWQHFGKAPQVTIFDVEDGKIVDSKVLQAPELPVEQVLAMFLNGTIVYGDPSCHHHCEGHHH